MSKDIINRVEKSSLISIDLEDYYLSGKRHQIDLKNWLADELYLKEKEFRVAVKNHDWKKYKDCFVAINCSSKAIIPPWAYMLISAWGAQTLYKSRIGRNSKHYTLGDRAEATIWSAFKVSKKLSLSTSINYYKLKNLEGYDSDLNSMMNPLVNSINSGRSQIDFGIGSNYIIPSTSLNKLRLSIQASYPLYQNVNGIQMKNTWSGVFGLKYSFKNTL